MKPWLCVAACVVHCKIYFLPDIYNLMNIFIVLFVNCLNTCHRYCKYDVLVHVHDDNYVQVHDSFNIQCSLVFKHMHLHV